MNAFQKRLVSTFVPGGAQAVQAAELAKVAQNSKLKGNARLARRADTLARAKKGDKRAQSKILAVQNAAKKGDPDAKRTVKELRALNKLTKPKGWYERGIEA